MFYCTTGLFAQNWAIGGNPNADVPAGGGRLGTNGDRSVIFETNNTERARLLNGNGFWGFGTSAPNAQVNINSAAGIDALRVQVNGSSKLFVHNGGGVSIGTASAPPANGLLVSGSIGVGTSTPAVKLHVVNGADASPGGGGFIVSGYTSGGNVVIDDNEIMARNNGAASTLTLNHQGGNLIIDGTNAGTLVGINTSSPAVDMHLLHGTGDGTNHGLRLRNSGANAEDWTFYVVNLTGNLELWANNVFRGSFDDVSGTYSSVSDVRRKKDIEKAQDVMEKLLQLDVKKYHFLENNSADKKHYGLIAQEVEKLFPELVSHNNQDDGSDIYTMDYTAFGVLAIKALQEEHKTLENLKQKNAELESRLLKLESALTTASKSDAASFSNIFLEQNMPNPFNQVTTIRYHVLQNANATITIYNNSGVAVKTIKANDSGMATIQANELSAGTYTYNLVVNGKLTASKKMVLLK